MPTITLSKVVETVPLEDLQLVAAVKKKLTRLRGKKYAIYKEIEGIEKKLEPIRKALPAQALDESGLTRMRQALQKAVRQKGHRRPSMESLILEILRESNDPVSINELADRVINERGYRTRSPNFKNQLRVLLYRNRKGLFRKVGPGRFVPAQEAARVTPEQPA